MLIIFDIKRTNENQICTYLNSFHKLELKPTQETNVLINYLDLTINRHPDHNALETYRKPTNTNTTIHYTSNHPMEHKIVAYRYLINRINTVGITNINKKQELNNKTIIAKNNALPTHITRQLYDTMAHKRQIRSNNTQTQRKTSVTFTYHSTLIRKVTNIFKLTGLSIVYRAINTLFNRLKNTKETQDEVQKSGIYKLTRRTCNSAYTGQTGKV